MSDSKSDKNSGADSRIKLAQKRDRFYLYQGSIVYP